MKTLLGSKAGVVGTAVALVALIGVGGWFLLVGPKRSDSTSLDGRIAGVEQSIAARRAELANPSADVRLRVSDLYRLAKAMPGELDVSGVMLEISRLAEQHGISFTSISPVVPVTGVGYTVQPLDVTLQGRFGSVSTFLADLRKLVSVRRKSLDVRGRLFSVDNIDLGPPDQPLEFPSIKAKATINAFVFTGAPAPADAQSEATGTTQSPTPSQTPTSSSSTATAAAGATP